MGAPFTSWPRCTYPKHCPILLPFSTWGQFRSQLLWGCEAGKLLPNAPIITGQLTHICWQHFLPLILGNILRFCWQHLLNNDPVHFRFYWFHLLYIFQKFLSVLVSWWNSSWFSSIVKDIFILFFFSYFYVQSFQREFERVEKGKNMCSGSHSHNCPYFEWFPQIGYT